MQQLLLLLSYTNRAKIWLMLKKRNIGNFESIGGVRVGTIIGAAKNDALLTRLRFSKVLQGRIELLLVVKTKYCVYVFAYHNKRRTIDLLGVSLHLAGVQRPGPVSGSRIPRMNRNQIFDEREPRSLAGERGRGPLRI